MQFKVTYRNVYHKVVSVQTIHVESVDEAMSVAMDCCLANVTWWKADIENRAGLVLSICLGAQNKPCGAHMKADFRQVRSSKKVEKNFVQYNLFA